jgi:uncharacterized membrane protein YczE
LFKPVRWSTFLRDLFVIEIGLGLFGVAIAVMIRANLGTSPWVVLEVALAGLLGITPGTMTVIAGAVVLSGALLLREQIGWGTLANILSIGPWIDLTLWLLPPVTGRVFLQTAMLLLAVGMMGLATAVYIGVGAGAGPRDSLMLALHRTFGWSLRRARATVEIIVVLTGWALGGPAGAGTAVFALLIGPAVQAAFKLLRVEPHQPAPEPIN